jgi:regulator of protease activity HflC (stomatin/prohibitin superfamily)
MFEFEHPLRHEEKPNWAHIIIAGVGLTIVLFAGAFTPDPFGRSGAVKRIVLRALLEWGPSILMLVATRLRASTPATAAALGFTLGGAIVAAVTGHLVAAPAGALIGVYLFLSVRVANQWEKCAVLRFGKYYGLRGPGIFHIIPIIDTVAAFVDERVRTTAVHAEAALTRDTVPVNVDAVIFWIVWDVEKAILEVQDFDRTVALIAQTALLESIGRHDLGQMIAERGSLGRELQRILVEKTTSWGITLQSVEIRDVRLPPSLQDAMSRQAQAERERQARIILGGAEVDISEKFAEAAAAYKDDPTALHLRAMNMLYEVIKEKGTMVVVPASRLRRRTGRAGLPGRSARLRLSALSRDKLRGRSLDGDGREGW